MKSNPSPSVALNLCAPVGVTGTTLPASPVKDTPVCTTYEPFDPECPALCKHCGGSEGSHAPASPVDSVGVPESPTVKLLGKLDSALERAQNEIERLSASHAAKDAKIQALTDALEKTTAYMARVNPRRENAQAVIEARAALAIPCA